jgi:hypothetical protein
MASEVYSGNGNFSYTNSTGQNVRMIVNFMESSNLNSNGGGLSITWAGVTVTASFARSIGRNIAFYSGSTTTSQSANNMVVVDGATAEVANVALPTEIMLAPNQGFSAVCGPYNIIVVKEDGS